MLNGVTNRSLSVNATKAVPFKAGSDSKTSEAGWYVNPLLLLVFVRGVYVRLN
jgi:hypothetical protein